MTVLLDFILGHEEFRSARLPSLYSDFRHLRTNNPNGFLANVTAWKTALSAATRAGVLPNTRDTLILHTGEELVSSLATREWGRPLALGTVVNESVRTQDLILLDVFLKQAESVYYKPWLNPWGILNWGLETAGLKARVTVDERLRSQAFVVLKNVEESAKKILQQMSSRPNSVGRIFTLELFAKEFANPLNPKLEFSEADLKVLIKFLSRDLREVSVFGNTIKFKNNNEDLTPVTENDVTVANLKTMVSSLHTQVEILAAKVAQSDSKVRSALNNNNKIVALAALKSKKIVESILQTRVRSLGQIEEVLGKIEQAADNVDLVMQLQMSTKVLQMLNKQAGGVEGAEDVMDALKEQMEEVEEITRAIGEDGLAAVDESEVEGELEDMLREEERKQEMKKDEARQQTNAKALELAPSTGITKSLEDLTLKDHGYEEEKGQEQIPAS